MSELQVLDCTLRDGGYYTMWDFEPALVEHYLRTVSKLPIDYVELGYRSPTHEEYRGEYYYLPVSRLRYCRSVLGPQTKIAVMVDQKSCTPEDMDRLLAPCVGLADLVRVTAAPDRITEALALLEKIQGLGFETALNLMYLSRMDTDSPIYSDIAAAGKLIDYLYLVDSYGSVLPGDLGPLLRWARSKFPQSLGFHGHDNIGLAFANALVGIEEGVAILDSTIQGMGRGAGNLHTELIVTYLSKGADSPVDLRQMSELSGVFSKLKSKFGWGMNFPYILSGLNDLPQKDIMEWLTVRRFSPTSIVRRLQSDTKKTEQSYGKIADGPLQDGRSFAHEIEAHDVVVLIGGGASVDAATEALREFATQQDAVIIHSSLSHVASFSGLSNSQIVCLPGDELDKIDEGMFEGSAKYIFAVSTSNSDVRLGSRIADTVARIEVLPDIGGERHHGDLPHEESPANIALSAARMLTPKTIYVAGFDGYEDHGHPLAKETQDAFDMFRKLEPGIPICSLTKSRYRIDQSSVFAMI